VIQLRFTGDYDEMSERDRTAFLDRSSSKDNRVRSAVSAIIEDVRTRGDCALRDLAERFDPAVPESLEVPRSMRARALERLEPGLRRAMQRAADNIATVHRASLPQPIASSPEPGISIIRRPDPLGRVGVYAPGGRAAYPSSVLMGAVPARIAGVGEVILCSPPDTSGVPSDSVLAAAELAGVDRVFAVGGAGAIAAMAIGTGTIPRVDRIVGPGNIYVAEAKLQLAGEVAIDSPAGPSELLVICDDTSDPAVVATEMLAQAEHDPSACVVALCVGKTTSAAVRLALTSRVCSQPRADIIADALATAGGTITVASLTEAIEAANAYAPEHLLLLCRDSEAAAVSVRGAGTVFIGETSSVSFGDYITGANHVLPTGGLARAYSGLSVLDFMRWTTVQRIDRRAAASLASDVAVFADAEGLPGHAAAALQWRTA
jgi:histidinol dehydrogenase